MIQLGNLKSNIEFLKRIREDWSEVNILEIGCGNGDLSAYLHKEGATIKAIDISEKYISNAKDRFPNIPLNTFEIMSGEKLKFPDNTFDYVLSFDVFEHIKDTDTHLKEISRILKHGGIYAFGTPNKITNIPWEIISSKSLTKWKSYHCSLHTYSQLKKRIEKHNFSYKFFKIPIMNDFVKEKLIRKTGFFGRVLTKIVNIDKLPLPLRTNFYVIAEKDN